jgi:Flp pilus assembly pilin Flp
MVVSMKMLKAFWNEEDGVGIIEIILILVILIMIIVIFREQIITIVTNAFKQINGDTTTINKKISI